VCNVGQEARSVITGLTERLCFVIELRVQGKHASVGFLELPFEALELDLAQPDLVEQPEQLGILMVCVTSTVGADLGSSRLNVQPGSPALWSTGWPSNRRAATSPGASGAESSP